MKTLLLNLWAWVVMHPVEVTTAFVGALVSIATVINARSKGPASTWFARFVDALSLRTRQGAQNAGWSWPLLGRSVFEAAIAASMPQPIEPDVSAAQTSSVYVYREGSEWIATPRTKSPILARGRTPDEAKDALRALLAERDTIAPDASGPRSSAGYVEAAVLRVIGGAALLALGVALLTGCPMPAPDGCSPGSRRCHEDTPQVCSPGQRWTPADVTCSTVNASCVVRDGVPACLRGEQ